MIVQQFLDGLAQNAESLVLIGALFAGLIALFIVLSGALRLVEFLFPSFARWLDKITGEGPRWDQPW